MGWKKALFFGGAVLVLAACDSATAPNARVRDGGASSALRTSPTTLTITRTALPTDTAGKIIDPLCSGWSVRTGDSTKTCLYIDGQ